MPLLSNLVTRLALEKGDFEKGMKGAAETARQFGKDSESVKKGTDQASAGIQQMRGVVGGLLESAVMVKAGQMALDFARESVDAASTAEQGYGKFQAVFKDSSDSVQGELVAMAEEIKRSKYDLMGYAATLQDTFVPLGFAREKAAEFSVELVGLAEDLASFNDMPTADVVRDLQSALVGNTETVRKYGVVATQTAIQQKALEMGIWDGTEAINAQEKALATYQIIMEGTADAHGTAAREAETYDSATRGLEAATLDLKVAIGNELLPTMTTIKNAASEWISSLASAVEAERALKDAAAAGVITRAEANEQINSATWSSYSFAEALEWLADKEAEYRAELEKMASVASSADQLFSNYVTTLENVDEASEDVIRSQADLKQELKDLQLFIKGPLGDEIDGYIEDQETLNEQAYELKQRIGALESEEYLTAEQEGELDTLQGDLEGIYQQLDENEKKHKEATKSILFDLIQQRAAVDGLSEAEMEFLNDVALEWGLVDEATHNAVKSIDQAMKNLAEGHIQEAYAEIEELKELAEDVAGDYSIHFNISSSGKLPVTVGDGSGTGDNVTIKSVVFPYKSDRDDAWTVGEDLRYEDFSQHFDFVSAVGGIAGGFADAFETRQLAPMVAEMDAYWDTLMETLNALGYDTAGIRNAEDLIAFYQGLEGPVDDSLSDAYLSWNQSWKALEMMGLEGKTGIYDQIYEQQADLDYLQQQVDLLNLITEAGLDADTILGGIDLGLGADEVALMEAMSNYLDAMISDTEDMLQAWNVSGFTDTPEDYEPEYGGGTGPITVYDGLHVYNVENVEDFLAQISALLM